MHMVAARLSCQSAMVGSVSGREGCLGPERVYENRVLTIACSLMSGHGQGHEPAC